MKKSVISYFDVDSEDTMGVKIIHNDGSAKHDG